MALPKLKCGGCLQIITNKQYLTCFKCLEHYDLDCANVSIQRFYNTMSPERKKSWLCQTCRSKMPKTSNTNTPIRDLQLASNSILNVTDTYRSPSHNNVTQRKKTSSIMNDSICQLENDSSILGDTQHISDETNPENSITCLPTMKQWENLLDKKFNHLKEQLVVEMRELIKSEMKNIASESKLNSNIPETQKQNTELMLLNTSIEILESTSKKLEVEINEIRQVLNNINNKCNDNHQQSTYQKDIKKKIVLYGFEEHHWEEEYELRDRIIFAFQDILNINLTGYLEDIRRIGKKGNRRPIVIELLSQQMTKNILQHGYYFKGTGIAISEYLQEESLKNRKLLIETLIKARQNGERAHITDNILYINGKKYTPAPESTNHPINEEHCKSLKTRKSYTGNHDKTNNSVKNFRR